MSKMQSSSYLNDSPENRELDEAFSKINMYLFACENKVVQKMLLKNLEDLSIEVIKQDNSLSNKLTSYINSIKMSLKRNK